MLATTQVYRGGHLKRIWNSSVKNGYFPQSSGIWKGCGDNTSTATSPHQCPLLRSETLHSPSHPQPAGNATGSSCSGIRPSFMEYLLTEVPMAGHDWGRRCVSTLAPTPWPQSSSGVSNHPQVLRSPQGPGWVSTCCHRHFGNPRSVEKSHLGSQPVTET